MEKEIGKPGEYIYLIQERESLRCNDNIYKIGKTKQSPMKRVKSYPKGSKLWILIIVNDATSSETDLLRIFNNKFKKADLGNEYFYGNPIEMVKIITQYQAEYYKLEENVNSQTVPQTVPQTTSRQNINSQTVPQTVPKQTTSQTTSQPNVNSQTVPQQNVNSQTVPPTVSKQTSSHSVNQQNITSKQIIPQQNVTLSKQIPIENITEAESIVQNYKTNDKYKVNLIGSLRYIKNPENNFNKRLEILNKILRMKQHLTTNTSESKITNNVTNDKINVNANVNTNVNKVIVDNKNSVNTNNTNANDVNINKNINVNANVNKVTINDNTNVNSNDADANVNNDKITNANGVNINTNINTSNDLMKPINLSRYKFLLEELIVKKMKLKRSCSVNIYVKLCSEANILEVKNIDVISANRNDIQKLQMEELKTGKSENVYKIKLNEYDITKFNRIKKDGINDYIIKINSLKRQKYKNTVYFETTFLTDSK